MPACPKPKRAPKEAKSRSSLRQKTPLRQKANKLPKETASWRKQILSHHSRTSSRADRAEFPPNIVRELIAEAGGRCQCGCGRPDNETHHVMPRTRGGRGVRSNGMRVNSVCNQRFHDNEEELQHWISVYTKRHGEFFWYDELDWEDHRRKQGFQAERQRREKELLETIAPVTLLVERVAGRKLLPSENRLIRDIARNKDNLQILASLVEDILRN